MRCLLVLHYFTESNYGYIVYHVVAKMDVVLSESGEYLIRLKIVHWVHRLYIVIYHVVRFVPGQCKTRRTSLVNVFKVKVKVIEASMSIIMACIGLPSCAV